MSPHEIESAILQAFDGTLDAKGCARLSQILKEDPAARRRYLEHASLQQLLTYQYSRRDPLDTANRLTRARLLQQRRRFMGISAAAAAVLILSLGLALHQLVARSQAPAATFRGDDACRYAVARAKNPSGDQQANELQLGDTVTLTQGSVEVTLKNGVRSVMLAPVKFQLVSDKQIKLSEGTAWFDVGRHGKGLQVDVPGMVVTDLGTQFGVVALPKRPSEIHVFSGKVVAASQAPLRSEETLTTGMARLSDPVGRLKVVPIRPEAFHTGLSPSSMSGLIANGDFEAGNPVPEATFGNPASASLLPAWRFGRDITVARATSLGRPGYGEREITILSSTRDVQVGFNSDVVGKPNREDSSVFQTFSTTPGQRYRVSFEMGGFFTRSNPVEITASVHDGSHPGWGDAGLASRVEGREPPAGSGYNPRAEFFFTARSGQSTLVFSETSPNTDDADPVLDNVFVEKAD